jgi:hypothetical protein
MKRWRYEARPDGVERPPGATAPSSEPPPSVKSPPEVPVQTLVSRDVPGLVTTPAYIARFQGKKHTYVWQCVSIRGSAQFRLSITDLPLSVIVGILPYHTDLPRAPPVHTDAVEIAPS